MPRAEFSRRNVLTASAGVAASAAIPPLAAPPANAVTTATAAGPSSRRPAPSASLQENLSKLVDMRFGMFNHFNMATFTDEEWATPNQDPKLFAPTSVDCAQWAAAAAAAKMSYGVLTTKHHDGFCLWPSAHGSYNVAHSSYPHDIVAQYVEAFRSAGLKVGLYHSVWDRTHTVQAYDTRHGVPSAQAVRDADMDLVLGQITELLTNYGPIDIWVNDGYAWQMGQQAVAYQRVRELVKTLQPNIIMIDHGGLSVPWLGDAIYFEEPLGITSPADNTYASLQGNTITNAGWFWHPQDPSTDPLSEASILSHLADLEPKWTSFILNCPPNRAGRLDDNIVARLAQVGAAWSPNPARPPLPTQQARCEHPITCVNAYATGWHTGEGPLNAIDGLSDKNFETCWSTWSPTPGTGALALPQAITVDLGGVWNNITTLEYLPKQWDRNESTDGDITSYTISTSTDGVTFTTVATGTWPSGRATKLAEWPAVDAGFVRLQADTATGSYSNVGALRIGGRITKPKLRSSIPVAGTRYRLINRNSGKAAGTATGTSPIGTAVTQQAVSSSAGQLWSFTRTPDGYFTLHNAATGTLLEVGGLSRNDEAATDAQRDIGAPQQQWAVTPTGDGYHILTNRFSGLALNVQGASTTDGANVTQYTYNAVPQQQWQLVPVAG